MAPSAVSTSNHNIKGTWPEENTYGLGNSSNMILELVKTTHPIVTDSPSPNWIIMFWKVCLIYTSNWHLFFQISNWPWDTCMLFFLLFSIYPDLFLLLMNPLLDILSNGSFLSNPIIFSLLAPKRRRKSGYVFCVMQSMCRASGSLTLRAGGKQLLRRGCTILRLGVRALCDTA